MTSKSEQNMSKYNIKHINLKKSTADDTFLTQNKISNFGKRKFEKKNI